MERTRRWRQRQVALVLAFALPLPLILVAAITNPVWLLVDLPVGFGAGLLSASFWPEDHLRLWFNLARQRRWRSAVGDSWPRNEAEVQRWLADHAGQQDGWVVSALLMSGRFVEAKKLQSELPPATTDEGRFIRKAADAAIDLNQDAPVDLDSLSSLADVIDQADARLRAQAQVANLGLGLASRGDITRGEALRRVKVLTPALNLPIQMRLFLLFLDFSGLVVVLALLVIWAVGLPLGYSHIGLP
jgi:hypothetical protein